MQPQRAMDCRVKPGKDEEEQFPTAPTSNRIGCR
jgi:hypothetical protein